MRRIERREEGIVLHLEAGEAELLRSLPGTLEAMLRRTDPASGPATRLFPKLEADADNHARELHTLMMEELRQQRLGRIEAVETLFAGAPAQGGLFVIKHDAAEHWLALLTDMRLLLAEQIGIEDDHWRETVDPGKPMPRETALYLYLSGLQSGLLEFGFGISQDAST